jgi:hypothetical protein
MRRAILRLLAAILLTWMATSPVRADLTGDVQGTVVDPAGAVVADAKVMIKSLSTGAARVLTTNSVGEFSSTQMAIGNYQITVEKDGFRTFSQNVEVRSGEKTRIEASLQVGNVSESVVVESNATPTLDVATAQVSDSITAQEALALPNQA